MNQNQKKWWMKKKEKTGELYPHILNNEETNEAGIVDPVEPKTVLEALVKISNFCEIKILKYFLKNFVKLKRDLHCFASM